jgi:hypothetical protein
MEESVFIKTVGNSPLARVLDFLIVHSVFDYSLTDIVKNSNVGWTTIHTFWSDLEKKGIVKQTRVCGRSKMYKLNMKHPVAKALHDFAFQVAKYYGDKVIEKQGIKVSH